LNAVNTYFQFFFALHGLTPINDCEYVPGMLKTVDDVVETLGGTAQAAKCFAVGPSAVSNWRARERIPADKFMLVQSALMQHGKSATPALFGFEVAA
jgi:hypothetical protein